MKVRYWYELTHSAGQLLTRLGMTKAEFADRLLLPGAIRRGVDKPFCWCPTPGLGEPFYVEATIAEPKRQTLEAFQSELMEEARQRFLDLEFHRFFCLSHVVFDSSGDRLDDDWDLGAIASFRLCPTAQQWIKTEVSEAKT